MAIQLECEIIEITLAQIGCLALFKKMAKLACYSRTEDCNSTDQVEDACRMILVLGAFGKEQKAFPSLTSMGYIVMSNLRLFTAKVLGEMLGFQGLVAEPEELLREYEAPNQANAVSLC